MEWLNGDVPLYIVLNGGAPYFYIEPLKTREDLEWMRAAHVRPTYDVWWTNFYVDEGGISFSSHDSKPTPTKYHFVGFGAEKSQLQSSSPPTSSDHAAKITTKEPEIHSISSLPDALPYFELKGDVKSFSLQAEQNIYTSPMYNALSQLCTPDSIHKIAFNQSGAMELNSLAPNIAPDYIFTYTNNILTRKSRYDEDGRDMSKIKLYHYKTDGSLAKIVVEERFSTTTIKIRYEKDGRISSVEETVSQMGAFYKTTSYLRSEKTDVLGNWVEREWSSHHEKYESEHTDDNGNTVKGKWVKEEKLDGVTVEKRNIEYYSEHPSFDLGKTAIGGTDFLRELSENGITERNLNELQNSNYEKYVRTLEICRKYFPDLKINIPYKVTMEVTDEQCERLLSAGYKLYPQIRRPKDQRKQSGIAKVNADGRKMVKSVTVYKWRSSKYKLMNLYAMEYNDKNELIKLSNYTNIDFPPTTYTRKGDIITGKNKYSDFKYHLNTDGKIISGEEVCSYDFNGKKINPNPYYHTLSFTYDEKGRLIFTTEKTLYHEKGKEYKENKEDRCYEQYEYRDGGTYAKRGGVSNIGEDYLVDISKLQRQYDTHSVYDINFNIEAKEFYYQGGEWLVPKYTEWSPTFPEYWLKSYGSSCWTKEYYYGYDENGNVTAIDIAYSDGDPYRRYEIEYVY